MGQTQPANRPQQATQQQAPQATRNLLPAMRVATYGQQLDLTDFNPERYNNLMPYQSVQPLSPLHMVSVQVVQISTDPEDNEVYPSDNKGKLRLAKRGLLKLGAGAGVVWVPAQTGIVSRTDKRVVYQAVGYMMTADGSIQFVKGTKEIDLDVLLDEITDQQTFKVTRTYDEKARQYVLRQFPSEQEKNRQIEAAVRREMLAKRKNMVALAETGAHLRAIRAVLALKNEYKPEELQKPFVVVRTSINPQADADLAREMVKATMGLSSAPALAQPMVAGQLQAPTIDVSRISEAPEEDEVYDGEIPESEEGPRDGRMF